MPEDSQFNAQEDRLLGLDLLRAFAAVAVVVVHGHLMIRKWVPAFLVPSFFDAVDLFFTLSGFLIGRIILREIVDAGYPGTMRALVRFWVRRWLRTLPAYYTALLLSYLLMLTKTNKHGFDWSYIVFLQNFWTRQPPFMANAWSLSIEEHFYLLFPLAVVLSIAVLRKRRRAAYAAAALLLIAGSLLLRRYMAGVYGLSNLSVLYPDWCRALVPLRFDAIAYGALGALIALARPAWWRRMAIPGAICAAALYSTGESLIKFPLLTWVFLPSLLPVITLLSLPLLTRLETAPRWFAAPVRHLSRISYAMYLVHYPLALPVIRHFFRHRGDAATLTGYVAYYVLTMALTYAIHYAAERPGLAWRKKISDRWAAGDQRRRAGA